MSTRYVYATYDVKAEITTEKAKEVLYASTSSQQGVSRTCGDAYYTRGFDQNGIELYYVRNGNSTSNIFIYPTYSGYATSDYPYAVFDAYYSATYYYKCCLCHAGANTGKGYWIAKDVDASGGATIRYLYLNSNPNKREPELEFQVTRGTAVKGDHLTGVKTFGKEQSSTIIGYNFDSATRTSKWIEYSGTDSIDPESVTYSTDQPRGNESIKIVVDPSRNKKYGGTVYYQYEYSLDGGTWTALGSKTTSLEMSYTIPRGAKTFQARVIASDNGGFTSKDYVTGAKLEVQSIQAYAGVNGTARRVTKMYIGVNGIAREVTGGYIGVNGVARKWF